MMGIVRAAGAAAMIAIIAAAAVRRTIARDRAVVPVVRVRHVRKRKAAGIRKNENRQPERT